jgi:glutathione synthase/RimK-type ligase-like ATP-grasp enzyme
MQSLIVVHNPARWSFHVPQATVVSARDYLTEPRYATMRNTRVYNLCHSYRYLSMGYYVSLLAEARGHRPLPTIKTIQDARSPAIVRVLSDELDALIQKDLASLRSKRFALSVYFGQNTAKRYRTLSRELFNLMPAPLLRAQFVRKKRWEFHAIATISSSEVPPSHRAFVVAAATDYFNGRVSRRKRRQLPYDIAILVDPGETTPPSDELALRRFARAAERHGMKAWFITDEDYGRIAEYDALFIRATTQVNHLTYRFASRAAAEGLVVVDDPESIVRCTNKVYLAELLQRHDVNIPRTEIVHDGNVDSVARATTYPCILKRPDSSFSQGVHRVATETEFLETAEAILLDSDLLIMQEFLPTDFDWRIGIFDRKPIYAARYYMAHKHWQILQWRQAGGVKEGRTEAVRVEDTPRSVVRAALRAANLIGDGFYGVDLKQVGRSVYIIEINDNPSIDAGYEDRVLRLELYDRIMRVFRERLDRQHERSAAS